MDDFTEANVLEAICIADISNLRALGIALEIPKHITEEILLHQPISDRRQMLVAEFFQMGQENLKWEFVRKAMDEVTNSKTSSPDG